MNTITWNDFGPFGWGEHPSLLMSSPQSSAQPTWTSIERQLLALRRLDDDWDQMGALAPEREVVDSALSFMRLLRQKEPLMTPSRVVSGPGGEVVFEWQFDGDTGEAEISVPGMVEFCWPEGGESECWTQYFGQPQRNSVWYSADEAA